MFIVILSVGGQSVSYREILDHPSLLAPKELLL